MRWLLVEMRPQGDIVRDVYITHEEAMIAYRSSSDRNKEMQIVELPLDIYDKMVRQGY